MLTVACVRVGEKYGPVYVDRLFSAVKRNLEQPFESLVIDDAMAHPLQGWWAKIALFKPGLFEGRVLFLDLDSVIVGSLDEIVEHKGAFRDWSTKTLASAVMCWDAGEHRAVWDFYASGQAICEGTGGRMVFNRVDHMGDQDYIHAVSKITEDEWPMFPPEWCVSYRTHAREGPPVGAKVVCMHGNPKQMDLPSDSWVHDYWH